jgi:exosortase A
MLPLIKKQFRGMAAAGAQRWIQACVLFFVSWVIMMALFWHTIQTMVDVWAHSRTYAHGFLALPATLYLVWCYRDRLLGISPVPSSRGLVLGAVLAGGWCLGGITETLLVQQIAVISMLPALVLGIFGSKVLRTLQFPLGFLVFALPIGTSIEPWLQKIAAMFIMIGLDVMGIPHHRNGYLITIPSGTWEVVPDCGGLRYLLPGLALGYVYTAVMHQTLKQHVSFLLVCVLLLTVANGARAYGIILGDHLGIAEGTDHRVFSYAVYGVTMLFLAWLGLKLSDGDIKHRITNVQQTDPRSTCEDVLQ